MNIYQHELQQLKPDDIVYEPKLSEYKMDLGYFFMPTASHGYLIVPKNDSWAGLAGKMCKFGYTGKLAYYLEEDLEAPEFLTMIGNFTKEVK